MKLIKDYYVRIDHKQLACYLYHRFHRIQINTGTSDRCEVYKSNDGYIVVLSYNDQLGYIAIDVYTSELKSYFDCFIEDYRIKELLNITPKRFNSYTNRHKASILYALFFPV